jgi:hypothetical protein
MQTGPRTAEGKSASSRNAMSHGLTSAQVVLPGENDQAFQQNLQALLTEHCPATPTEVLLVEEMAQAHWRLQRARRQQDQAFQSGNLDIKLLALLHRYSTGFERAFYKALETLKKLQSQRAATNPAAFVSQNPSNAAILRLLEASTAPPQVSPEFLGLDDFLPHDAQADAA